MNLVRHTSIVAAPGLCYGRWVVPLADTFEDEVRALLSKLPGQPEAIWSSPAERCRALAERMRGQASARVDERLAELNFGNWEGRHWDDLRGPDVDRWMQNPWNERPPGGESARELWGRVEAFRTERLKGEPSKPVIVVTHAGVIRAWRSLAENRPWTEMLSEKIPFGSVWEVD